MAIITRTKSWIDRECLTHTDLNAEFNNIIDNIIASDLTNKGMIERATDAEVVDGTDEERAVTPAGMLARTGTTARIGLVQLEDSHTSVLTTKAACPKNVKEAYDLAGTMLTKATFDANTFIYAVNDNTPVIKTRAEVMALLSGQAGADFALNTHKITGLVDPTTDQEAATKKYVDDNIGSGGNVVGPATHSASYVPQWDATPNSKTLIEGFTITAAGKALIDDATAIAQRTTLGLGTAATRAAEDSMTDGDNLPDGHAIKAYGDANWSGGGSHFVTPGAGTLSAAAAAASDGDVLWLKEGVYTETIPITITSKSLSIIGAGPEVSIIRCTGTHGIVADTNSTVKHITLENFTIETTSTGTYRAITLEGAVSASNVNKQFYIRNLNIVPYDITLDYWSVGIRLSHAWHTMINGCHIRGKNNDLNMSKGIEVSTNSVDVSVIDCNIYFADYGIYAGPTQGEGLLVDNSAIVYVNRAIYCNFTSEEPHLGVFNSHTSSFVGGILGTYVHQAKIVGNLIYKQASSDSNWVGIHFTNGNSNNIDSNMIRGQGTGGSEHGIILSTADINIVSNNIVDGQDVGIWLNATSDNNIVAANITKNCVQGVTNQGTGNSVTNNLDV
jgi:parallel beta-helix repeat protein